MSNSPRLYSDLAYLWPIISPPGEYAEEAACWREVLQDKLGPGRHHILELGAGEDDVVEHRYSTNVRGWKVSGQLK